jgi:TatD DNase family protein
MSAPSFVDTHCHLDAWEFGQEAHSVVQRAREASVAHCVIPAVHRQNFETVRALAHATANSYCLGIHPLYVPDASEDDLVFLDSQLAVFKDDPRLVAVGEIGLDYFVPALQQSPLREKQEHFYRAQLKLARKYSLPVVLHVRRSADRLLKSLRDFAKNDAYGNVPWRGIAHAFNGSDVQAHEFIKLGLKLGFGGAVSFERALQLRHLAKTLPQASLVLETDAPDIPPHWLYATAAQRAQGQPQGRNEPAELPHIAQVVADLRSITLQSLADLSTTNARQALPRLSALLV